MLPTAESEVSRKNIAGANARFLCIWRRLAASLLAGAFWFALAIGSATIGPTVAAYADDTLSIAVNTNLWSIGALPSGGVTDSWRDAPGAFSVANSGTVPARVLLSVELSDPDGWRPGGSAGEKVFRMGFALDDNTPKPRFQALSETPVLLYARLDPAAIVRFDLEFRAPANVGSEPQTIRIVVAALPLDGGVGIKGVRK
jgi:hypothetical protein